MNIQLNSWKDLNEKVKIGFFMNRDNFDYHSTKELPKLLLTMWRTVSANLSTRLRQNLRQPVAAGKPQKYMKIQTEVSKAVAMEKVTYTSWTCLCPALRSKWPLFLLSLRLSAFEAVVPDRGISILSSSRDSCTISRGNHCVISVPSSSICASPSICTENQPFPVSNSKDGTYGN